MLRATDKRARLHVAMHMAADHIERHPREFLFLSCVLPHPCQTPGCALGWTAYFYGMNGEKWADWGVPRRFAEEVLGLKADDVFYREVHRLLGSSDWLSDPTLCARGMRLYADKHFAPVDVETPA